VTLSMFFSLFRRLIVAGGCRHVSDRFAASFVDGIRKSLFGFGMAIRKSPSISASVVHLAIVLRLLLGRQSLLADVA
jgi:hypothetical protein